MKLFQAVPSKLLLFGEYSILSGSSAITLPLWDYSAKLILPESKNFSDTDSNQQLTAFVNFLNQSEYFKKHLNLHELIKCTQEGLFLDSNIPQGYGLGSSAGLCVALYKAFGISNLAELPELKEFYSHMESFFHGKSSGLDPLTIHTEKALLVNNTNIETLPDINLLTDNLHLYLFDSEIPRAAAHLITGFKQMLENAEYKNFFEANYLPLLHQVIHAFIHQQPNLWNNLKKLSEMQFFIFRKMIPESINPVWEQTVRSEEMCMKILGAGGGGFFLLFSKSKLNELEGFKLKEVLKNL